MKAYRTVLTDLAPDGTEEVLYPVTRANEVYVVVSEKEEIPGVIRNGQTLDVILLNLLEEIEYLKKSASDGKRRIASAITEKGVPTEPDDTYEKMAENILAIKSGEDVTWK